MLKIDPPQDLHPELTHLIIVFLFHILDVLGMKG